MPRITDVDETTVEVEQTVSTGLSELLAGARKVTIEIDYGWDEEE